MKYIEVGLRVRIYRDLAENIMDPDGTVAAPAVREFDLEMNSQKHELRMKTLNELGNYLDSGNDFLWKDDPTVESSPRIKATLKSPQDMSKLQSKAQRP